VTAPVANGLRFKRFRLQPDRRLAFFQEFLRHPHQVGSIIPSSRFLEWRLVELSGVVGSRVTVELGPGTGGTTRAILQALPASSRLLAVEINPQFVNLLRRIDDERLIVHPGSAKDIADALAAHGLGAPDVVLSGLPFSTMPTAIGSRILRAIWAALAPGGHFVAYQFRGRVAVLGREILGRPEVEVELRNVPPMRVYRWRKPAAGNGDGTPRRS